MSEKLHIVLCSVPDEETARQMAQQLVGEALAACISILPGMCSVYRWKGKIETEREALLLIKSGETVYTELEERIRAMHPYELPEIIAVPICNGHSEYLNWIANSLGPVET